MTDQPGVDSDSQRRTDRQQRGSGVQVGEVCTLLKNERRRRVVTLLAERPETTLSELAGCVAARENDTTPEQLTSSERKRVYISLYQNHLPALAEAEAIEYDRGNVTRLQPAVTLQRCLGRLETVLGAETSEPVRDGDDANPTRDDDTAAAQRQ